MKTETFAEVEEKLCKIHNELRNTNNTFTANTLPILRFKTIAENNIKDGDVISLYKIEWNQYYYNKKTISQLFEW